MARKKKENGKNEVTPAVTPEVVAPEVADDDVIVAPEIEILPPEKPEDLAIEVEEPVAVEEPEAKTTGLVRYDTLQAYLAEIRRLPRLSKEEEHELALRYFKEKDMEAAYKLISSNLWLVVRISREYEKAARSLLDLIQEGSIGLMEAVKNFDPFRNVRFPSYAAWWIRAYVVRYVIANWRLVKIGTTQAQRKLFFNLKKEKEKLEREGLYAAPKLLAEKLDVKESEVIEMEQRLAASDLSVDAPIDADNESNLLGVLPGSEATAEDIVSNQELRELLSKSLDEFAETLNEKEKVVFRERMLSEEKVTLEDIAQKLDLSRERIRQLENKIREKLKGFLIPRLGSGFSDIEY